MRHAIRTYSRPAAAVLVLIVASIAIGLYLLSKERLQLPFSRHYTVVAEVTNAAGIVPGLGEPANVAGVKVGEITGVKLRDGRAVVSMSIERHRLAHVYANASAVLHPNTPLEDMQIDISPGGPPAAPLANGQAIPVGRTQVPLQSDNLLGSLDTDTRDYLTTLLAATGIGLHQRGPDLRALLRTLAPTTRQLRELSAALAGRRSELARVVHNLSTLAQAVGTRDAQLGRAVTASDETLRALAGQDRALGQSLALLPGTLGDTRRTLVHATAFADRLTPTLQALEPGVRQLPHGLRAAGSLLRVAEPVIRSRLRPLVATATPVIGDLVPAADHLRAVTPDLASAFQVLRYTVNELNYNQGGLAQSNLFWLAWYGHNTASLASTGDANGRVLHGELLFSCSGLTAFPAIGPVLQPLLGTNAGCQP